MAFQVTITIPGDAATEGSAANRLKTVIDYAYRDFPAEEQPSTGAEYQAAVKQIVADLLRSYVVKVEKERVKRLAFESISDELETE